MDIKDWLDWDDWSILCSLSDLAFKIMAFTLFNLLRTPPKDEFSASIVGKKTCRSDEFPQKKKHWKFYGLIFKTQKKEACVDSKISYENIGNQTANNFDDFDADENQDGIEICDLNAQSGQPFGCETSPTTLPERKPSFLSRLCPSPWRRK